MVHTVVAAASSSSASRAQDFLTQVKAPSTAKAYGSYAELVRDPNIDVIYVATPHSHHFQNVMLCLEAGKNVLCEKAFTVNAAQAKKLAETARAKNLFLMEAVWTRYFPLSIKIRQLVTDGVIGHVYRVVADISFNKTGVNGMLTYDDSNRMVNLDLAGGALLDLGIYCLTWVFQILYHCQKEPRESPTVVSAMNKYERTGSDEMNTIVVQFPLHQSMGIVMTGFRAESDRDRAVTISGSKGEIQVLRPAIRPTRFRVLTYDTGKVEEFEYAIPKDKDRDDWGHGMFWEADEVARCLRDRKKESETLPLEESVLIMETMDKARKAGGLVYPEMIETAMYDAKSPLNLGNA